MPKNLLLGSVIAGGGLVAVAVTVTLVLTLQESRPKPQLEKSVAKASQGYLVGQVTPEAGIFFGIPFSQPPVGEYRWKKPREPVKFPGQYWDATFIRPACVQICNQPAAEYSCPHEYDEDCLYLNVWVPRSVMEVVETDEIIDAEHYVIPYEYQQTDENSLAVMLWLYGGNFLNGAGSVTVYDGRYLASLGNVIIVTMNYRTGPLGFLVQGEGEDAATGNYGIWDQIRALEWIKDNIQFFGGNPNKVTIFGQSAGSESLGVLMTSPAAEGLFHQGIMESNPFGLPFRDTENAKKFGAEFTQAAGCLPDDMKCLRSIDPEGILQAYKDSRYAVVSRDKLLLIFQPWSPVIDGDFLPEQPIDSFKKGNVMNIPSMFGGTADEVVLYVALAFPTAVNNLQYRAVLKAVMQEDYRPVIQQYPPVCPPLISFGCDNRDLMSVFGTEYLFHCATRLALNSLNTDDKYFYIFDHVWSFSHLWEIPMCFDAACHGSEIPYVFNTGNLTVFKFTPEEQRLATRMGTYWTNFAKYGNPNGNLSQLTESDISWPKFRQSSDIYTAINLTGDGDFVLENPYEQKCDFFDDLDSYGLHFMNYR